MNHTGLERNLPSKAAIASALQVFLHSGLNPQKAEPKQLRQVKILNILMLIAAAMCLPLGVFWGLAMASSFAYAYLAACVAWVCLIVLLRRTHNTTQVGRAAVFVLFALCTGTILLLGGTKTNFMAWFMMMPLAAAVCVGKKDLWLWGVIATLAPVLIQFYPQVSAFASLSLTPELEHQLSSVAISLGTLVISILAGIWISHHETLAEKLDASVIRLEREANAHRLLIDSSMLASGETTLKNGVRKLLEQLQTTDEISACYFWDVRDKHNYEPADYHFPASESFKATPLLSRTLRTSKPAMSDARESGKKRAYYPVLDQQQIAGVIELVFEVSHTPSDEDLATLEQIAIQVGYIAERERTARAIAQEAQRDSLTSLKNRRAFRDTLDAQIAQAERERAKVALLYIDLNDFKRINDSLGHSAGDAVLKVVAKRLAKSIRHTDRGSAIERASEDFVSRIGGDEFTLILDDIQSSEDADRAAQRLLGSLAAPIQLNGQNFKIGASIGIAIYPDDAQHTEALIRSADAAMYSAKRRGGDRYSRYNDKDKAVESLSFELEMRNAIELGQMEMHYQPVFDCQTREPVGAEALIRWRHPERGWVPPDKFIPLAENIGYISEIGKFQFEAVLQWFKTVRSQLPKDFRIALNLSPMQIQDTTFVDWLLHRLAASQLPLQNIELEITETALLEDTDEIQSNVRALANLGLCITLDDFGTGQSSLSLLKRFPIGRIKIDRSFVNGLPNQSEDVAIVGAVLSLAKALEIPAVAEGVEEEVQLAFLALRECEDMQGYLLAKPMPGDELAYKLASSAFTAAAVQSA